ncbi:MAG: iron ABC transporter permease [Candidatus Omnitrophota bacterium]
MKRVDPFGFILLLTFCLLALIIISCFIGPVRIPFASIIEDRYIDILRLRFFRIMLAVAVGSGLSLAGVMLQGILRNPLAEPYVLGVSSGAGLGAVIGLLFFSAVTAGIMAFVSGILTIIIVFILASADRRLSPENMIISGILVNALFSSLLMFFVSNSSSAKVHSVIWWLLGNMQVYKGTQVVATLAIVASGLVAALFFSKELDALSLGEEEAFHLGIDVERIKKIFLAVSALIASVIVSMCGIIGFVGLMIPHIVRRLVGPAHKALIITSALAGGIFLLLCDGFARTVMAPKEIPVGVITSFLGVPFFIYILKRSKRIYFK